MCRICLYNRVEEHELQENSRNGYHSRHIWFRFASCRAGLVVNGHIDSLHDSNDDGFHNDLSG